LAEAIPLLEAKGESDLADLAAAWCNFATAQTKLSEPEEREEELAAAREANRRLMTELNHRQALLVSSSRDRAVIVRS
jgi:hypothetical protein